MAEKERQAGLSLMGQTIEWPTGPWGAVSFLALCLVLSYAVYAIHDFAKTASEDRIDAVTGWFTARVERDGTRSKVDNARKIEFWTPSHKTVSEGLELEEKDAWEGGATEAKVAEFGEKLKAADMGVTGYRRWEVMGRGRTRIKAGWWWSMNVQDNFDLGEFALLYRTFWNAPDVIYVEVTQTSSDLR